MYYLKYLAIIIFIISCKREPKKPINFNGHWVLIQTNYFGNNIPIKDSLRKYTFQLKGNSYNLINLNLEDSLIEFPGTLNQPLKFSYNPRLKELKIKKNKNYKYSSIERIQPYLQNFTIKKQKPGYIELSSKKTKIKILYLKGIKEIPLHNKN